MKSPTPRGEWPPRFFGIGVDKEGRTDNRLRVDEILAEGFGDAHDQTTYRF